jgi:hypothetical protein
MQRTGFSALSRLNTKGGKRSPLHEMGSNRFVPTSVSHHSTFFLDSAVARAREHCQLELELLLNPAPVIFDSNRCRIRGEVQFQHQEINQQLARVWNLASENSSRTDTEASPCG